jgi:hypothetical protein
LTKVNVPAQREITYPLDALVTLATGWGKVFLVAVLAVEVALLLHEAYINEWLAAGIRGAVEVVRAPVLAESGHERTSEKTQVRTIHLLCRI